MESLGICAEGALGGLWWSWSWEHHLGVMGYPHRGTVGPLGGLRWAMGALGSPRGLFRGPMGAFWGALEGRGWGARGFRVA
jgi:hypothetical protein